MSKPERVEFKTVDGVTLRGDFHRADGENRPIVVMTPGLALLKEFVSPFAALFRDGGVSVLLFDYRSYGSSDGEPRHETDLIQQADDYHDAVTAAMDLPGVDPRKTVLWGVGHGGAATIIAAADDPRPAAVILQSPIVSGRVDSEGFPKGSLEQAWRDRENKTRRGDLSPTYVQAWPESIEQSRGEGDPVLFQFEAAFGLITSARARSEAAGTPWENKITLRSLQNVASVEPRDWLHKIAQPTLYITPPSTPFTGTAEYQRQAFERMGSNGEFQVYSSDGSGGSIIDPQLAFLGRVL